MVMDIFEFIKMIDEIEVIEHHREGYLYEGMKIRYKDRIFIIEDYGEGPIITDDLDEEGDDL